MFSEQRMPIARSISFGYSRKTSAAGIFSRFCSSSSCVKAGVSSSFRRIHRPIATSTPDRKNGTRQPQLENASSLITFVRTVMRTVEMSRPPAKPIWGPGPVEAATPLGGVLGDHEHGPAPFAAQREPLDEAQGDEQDRREHADRVVAGQAADQDRRDAHDQQAEDEHLLAPDLVAVV